MTICYSNDPGMDWDIYCKEQEMNHSRELISDEQEAQLNRLQEEASEIQDEISKVVNGYPELVQLCFRLEAATDSFVQYLLNVTNEARDHLDTAGPRWRSSEEGLGFAEELRNLEKSSSAIEDFWIKAADYLVPEPPLLAVTDIRAGVTP